MRGTTIEPDVGVQEQAAAPWDRRATARKVLAGAIGVALGLVPILASAATALLVAALVEPPSGAVLAGWWLAVIALSLCAAAAAGRLVRRAMPLVGLYRLALLLPADVPSRLGLALRAGTLRELEHDVIDLRDGSGRDAAAQVIALAAALHRHDRFTRGHSERVRAYTDLVAAELGLPKRDRERLRWASLLHDIGKLEVPPRLLNKPAKLDDDEWARMRSHPEHGARIAEPLRSWLGEWVGAVGQHHERYDGNGYPNRLAGAEISLAGRVVAVADAYETMTARRPYKRPISHEAAREELLAQAGGHFDPRVVRAMLTLSVRRLRWAAGPLSVLGDTIAAQLISFAPAGAVVSGGIGVIPTLGATAAAAVVGATAGVVPAAEPPAPAPVGPAERARPSSSEVRAADDDPMYRGAGVGPLAGTDAGVDDDRPPALSLPPELRWHLGAGAAAEAPGHLDDGGTWTGPAASAPASPPALPAVGAEPVGGGAPAVPAVPAVPPVSVPRPEEPLGLEKRPLG